MYWKILSWEKGWNLGWDLLCSQLPLPLPPSLWAGTSEHPWPLHPSWVTKLLGLISSTSKYLPCLFPLLPSHEVQVLTWNTAGSFWNASPVRDSLLKMFQRLSGSSKTKSKSPHRAYRSLCKSPSMCTCTPSWRPPAHPRGVFPMCSLVPEALGSFLLGGLCSYVPGRALNALHKLTHFIFTTTLWSR